ncbi:MAG: SpoIVB peptidase [Ruminococcaceae bacterium]|nr:SpoIVB peptidase [Oscillospiraceae bacterium]
MKIANKIIKALFFTFLISSVMIFSGVVYLENTLDSEFKIKNGDSLTITAPVPITAEYNGAKLSNVSGKYAPLNEFSVNLKAFGIIPISSAKVEVVDQLQVAVLGMPFGMKIYTKGVLVSDITSVSTQNGNKNPAKKAGIKVGDYILSVNGKQVYTNEDLGYIVESSGGKNMKFCVIRGKTKLYFNFSAVMDKNTEQYKIGVWVKDSSAGIGTLTFYSPSTNLLCGLGHGICDDQSKKLLKINSGEIVSAQIISIDKGKMGTAGQLKGKFNYDTLGDIRLNCNQGVYGTFKGNLKFTNLTEIALKQEIKEGKAQIITTIDGEVPKAYSCKIALKGANYNSSTQNMIVTVTDKELLEKTGGIVQGMSGSPILQNGKLIGAITHVLLEDSTKGYAIFAENMLETAQSVANEQLKEAS